MMSVILRNAVAVAINFDHRHYTIYLCHHEFSHEISRLKIEAYNKYV